MHSETRKCFSNTARCPPAVLPLALLAGLFAGCSRPVAETSDYDSNRAREVLIDTFDAWKRGQANGLARRDPPIRFVDDDLVEGFRLVEYTLPEASPIKAFENIDVKLVLRDKRGATIEKTASYQVGLTPHLHVLRSGP